MGENNTCKNSVYCITGFLVVLSSVLVQVLIVGILFVLPFYQDCDNTIFTYISPIEMSSSNCLSNSSIYGSFVPPPTCRVNNSFPVPYCYNPGCQGEKCLIGPRCCCRSIPQVLPICGSAELHYNTSCVYALCEKSLHSVLLQVYSSSDLGNPIRLGLSGVSVKFGEDRMEISKMDGTIILNDIPEGDYPIYILASNSTPSREYFHASNLVIDFYSPSEIVYVINVKNLSINSTMISDCNITSMSQSIHTTMFNNSIHDLLTLPNTFMYNGSFFIPSIVAFTYTPNVSINFNINCTGEYTLFYFNFTDGEWMYHGEDMSNYFNLNLTGNNSVLWSLSTDTSRTVYTLDLNLGTSSLLLDRGAVLLLTNSWFVSRATIQSRTILSIPVINSTNIMIRSTTSPYSHLIPKSPVLEFRNISTADLTNNCSNKTENLSEITDSNTAVLSVTNSPTFNLCYFPMNATQSISKIFALIARRNTDNITNTVYVSTLETNDNYACLPYPCDGMTYSCEVSVQGEPFLMSQNCPDLEQSIGSNALALMECNSKLQTWNSQN